MAQEFAEQEYFVLHLLSVSEEPLGAGSIREELARNGMDLSEASVGRLLRGLDTRGFTSRVGYQGRLLTPAGEKRLSQLQSEREQIVSTGAFLEAVKSREKEMLLEILVARRAIEREMAALAAESRTRADLDALRDILDRQNALLARGEPMASTDPEFHEEVARISGNKVLQSAIEIIRRSGRSFLLRIHQDKGGQPGRRGPRGSFRGHRFREPRRGSVRHDQAYRQCDQGCSYILEGSCQEPSGREDEKRKTDPTRSGINPVTPGRWPGRRRGLQEMTVA